MATAFVSVCCSLFNFIHISLISKLVFFIFRSTELLVAFTSPDDLKVQRYILDRLSTYCNKPVTNHTEDEFIPPYQWTFYHSVFFAFIVCSTLGN